MWGSLRRAANPQGEEWMKKFVALAALLLGVFCYDGLLFLTADDGTADDNEPDHLYRVDVTSAINAQVVLEKNF